MMKTKAILTLAAALGFALSPLFVPGFGGFDPDRFPIPQVDPPIQPAGWAFSIWGVIYLWLLGSALFGVLRRAQTPAWDRVRWPLIVSLGLGTAWLPVAMMSPILSTVLIWVMLAAALVALDRAPDEEWLKLRAPIALYAGWLTAASCVATGILATGYGAQPVTPVHGAFVLLALGIAITMLRRRPDPAYALALIWALVGIFVANLTGGGTGSGWAFLVLIAVALGLLLLPLIAGLRREASALTATAAEG
ncbi:hypothetical protein [Pseudooceanicola aestuarii]|uniref:hypothetical protein n=1 Tax=Pseudooceanicola aestuarii TaxID=2697319 RepID=UPI0013D8379A|nr:hypothetical protein [Pseudooceanicola aestuarii]